MGVIKWFRGFKANVISKQDLKSAQGNVLWGFPWGNSRSNTGLIINEDNALSASGVWSAVTQLSQSVAGLPLHLYKRLQPRGKERYTTHPCYKLLHLQPNPEMTAMNFREQQMGQALLNGTCYAEIQMPFSGDNIQALWPLMSANMEVMRGADTEIVYKYKLPNGDYHYFKQDQVLRVTGFSQNGLIGHNVIQKLTESIALNLSLEEYQARFFSNGAIPRGVLEHPQALSSEARDNLEKSWEKSYGGLSNSNRVAILEEGMKLNTFGVNPADAQALEGRTFQLDEVARIFNMPPHMLKNLSKSSFNNIEQQSLEYVKYSLRPWLVRFEQAYNTQLLRPVQQNKLFFEHLIDGLLRGDAAARHASYVSGRNWGYYSANDIREFENMNPLPGKEGDMYLVPMNMVPADQAADPPEPPPMIAETIPEAEEVTEEDEVKAFWKVSDLEVTQEYEGVEIRVINKGALAGIDRVVSSHKRLMTDAAQRIVNKEVASARKAVSKGRGGFKSWMDSFYKTMPGYIRKNWKPVQMALMKNVSDESMRIIGEKPFDELPGDLEKWADAYLDRFVERYIDSSKHQFNQILKNTRSVRAEITDEEAFAALLNTRLDEMQEKRPLKISTDEGVRESNAAARETYKSQGITKLKWVTRSKKPCAVCDGLNDKTVGIETHFIDPRRFAISTRCKGCAFDQRAEVSPPNSRRLTMCHHSRGRNDGDGGWEVCQG